MAPFPILFFIFVELPSMAAMTVHKGIMVASGRETKPLNVWLYRLVGVTGLLVLIGSSFLIGTDAACLVFILAIAGGLVGLAVQRNRATAGTSVGPHSLPGVLGDLARRSLGDLQRFNGVPARGEEQCHQASADLMAALRFYQVAIDARWTDHEIGSQLAVNPIRLMTDIVAAYRRLPPSVERDTAIAILHAYMPRGQFVTCNLYTTWAGNALRQSRRP